MTLFYFVLSSKWWKPAVHFVRIRAIGMFLIAALIFFSAGYYCARIFFTSSNFFSLYQSEFEHQLLNKAIQNEQSRYKKLKSEIETE